MWKWGLFVNSQSKCRISGRGMKWFAIATTTPPHNAADNSAICAILFALLLVLLYQHNYAVKYAKYRGIVSVQ